MRDFPGIEVTVPAVIPRRREPRTVRDLRAVRVLIENGWTGGTLAVNRRRRAVSPHASDAVAFCLRGAASRVAPVMIHPIRQRRLYRALERAALSHGYSSFIQMNDSGGASRAFMAIDTAIAYELAR